ncbi:unknown [Ruminococcus sp. CAG:17]|nr:unknown [Ruminococcus sp. CAG:17]
MDKDLAACDTSSKKQMSEISHMLKLLIKAGITLQEKLPHTGKDFRHIRMHQLTVICIQDIVSAALLMKSKGQRTILILIAKGKLHLVAVSKLDRTSVDSIPVIQLVCILSFFCLITVLPDLIHTFSDCPIQKFPYLALLHLFLRLITHGLVHTAATGREFLTGRFSCLQRRFLQNF